MMKHPIPLQMALANVKHGVVAPDEFYSFIESHAEDVHTFWLDPEKTRGRVVGAAIEYLVILGAVGSVASIAALLWMAYDKFIGKKKKSEKDDAGLYISIEYPEGTRYNFWLGKDYKDRDIFIEEFTEKVEELQNHPDAASKTEEVIASIIHEDLWTQRK
jgi:hypothetical protein